MEMKLLPLLRCPAGGGALTLEGAQPAGDGWVAQGTLICQSNGRRYPIRNGMPYLYVDDERWQPKAREAAGWVQFHKNHQIYEQSGVGVDFQLPYFPHEPWVEVARQFDIALELTAPHQGKWVLDVGAGRSWAAKHFALRGASAVAVEINDDDQIGLGRSNALMEQAGVRYSAAIADSENLPFADRSFDIVFSSAALHHTSHLDLLLQNIARVLRPGGLMVAIHEPCVADSDTAEDIARVVAEERAYGINENHPYLGDYRRAMRGAGLKERAVFAWQAYGMPEGTLAIWSEELGVEPPAAFAAPPSGLGRLISRLAPLRGPAPPPQVPPQRWMDNVLRHKGGGLILLAGR